MLFLAAAALAAGCGGGGGASDPAVVSCGSPPPVPIPQLWLSYPVPGSTAVPTTIGMMIFAGNPNGRFGTDTLAVTSATGNLSVGSFTTPPSPLPTPYATPSNYSGNVPFVAVSLPTLAPATAYEVSYTYTDWSSMPPACTQKITQQLGSFTTR